MPIRKPHVGEQYLDIEVENCLLKCGLPVRVGVCMWSSIDSWHQGVLRRLRWSAVFVRSALASRQVLLLVGWSLGWLGGCSFSNPHFAVSTMSHPSPTQN